MFSKIEVNGDGAHPLYKYLKYKQPGPKADDTSIEWNFTKFIVDKNGQVSLEIDEFADIISNPFFFCLFVGSGEARA